MQIKYSCNNTHCSYPGHTHYEIQFNPESIMDIKNFAPPFCRFCKQAMRPSVPMAICDGPANGTPGGLKFEIR